MATVELTAGLLRDSTGLADKRPWYVYAASYTGGSDGVVTTKRSKPIYPVGSTLTIRAEAGIVAYIEDPDNHKYLVDIPETSGDLWDVIEAGVAFPPDTSQERLNVAVAQYVESNREQFKTRAVPITEGPDAGKAQWVDANGDPVGDPVPWDQVIATAVAEAAATAAANEVTPGIVTTYVEGQGVNYVDNGDGTGAVRIGDVVLGTFEGNHITWSGIPGMPAVLGAGATQFAARQVLGLGGTTSDTLPVNAADPQFGGLVNDGNATARTGTDNYPALLAAANYAYTNKRPLYIPAGVYRCDGTIPWWGKHFGDGPASTTIFTTVANTPVFATRSWLTAFGGSPTGRSKLLDMTIVGAGMGTGLAGHGVVWRDYYSMIDNVRIQECGGRGINLTQANQAGSIIASTLVENIIGDDVTIRNCTDTPLFLGESDNNKITDGFVGQVVLASSGQANHMYVGSAAGWQIGNLHTYGTPTADAIVIRNCYHTMLGKFYVEAYAVGCAAVVVHLQGEAQMDALSTNLPTDGSHAVVVYRSSVLPASRLHIGYLAVRNNNDVAGVAVKNTTSLAHVSVGSWRALGAYASRVSLRGGTTAQDVVRTMTGAVAHNGRLFVDRGDGTDVRGGSANSAAWNGNTAKALNLELPMLASYGKLALLVSIQSRSNHNGAVRAEWVGMVFVSAKLNGTDAWVVNTLTLSAATGFDVAPTVTVTHSGSGYGHITVSFQATNSDAYGEVSYICT